MTATKKIIYLARHAKSSWDSDAPSDFERPLSARGERDAKHMGEALNRLGWRPRKIIASPALRAKQTCLIYCEALSIPPESVVWNRDIYAAYMVTLLHSLNQQPETLESVMLVGHNPSMENLLTHLCGEAAVQAHRQANGKLMTTANVAKIEVATRWKELVMCEAGRFQLLRPKQLNAK